MGFRKGDFLTCSLPLLNEHIMLASACFRLGVIHVPLDSRLQSAEVLRSLSSIQAKGFAFLGKTAFADFLGLGEAVRARCHFVEHLIQFSSHTGQGLRFLYTYTGKTCEARMVVPPGCRVRASPDART